MGDRRHTLQNIEHDAAAVRAKMLSESARDCARKQITNSTSVDRNFCLVGAVHEGTQAPFVSHSSSTAVTRTKGASMHD
jgi:hypothetical protein